MKNKVELVIGDDFIPYYKVELYLRVEDLQDMRYSGFKDEIPNIVGTIVLDEIEQFKEQFKEDMKTRMVRESKLIVP